MDILLKKITKVIINSELTNQSQVFSTSLHNKQNNFLSNLKI